MNIVWAALAICLIVAVVFYALALSWQRTLRGHSRAIRTLHQRLESLELMEDPFLRHRISKLAPSQLEEVWIFNLNLSERFWRNAVDATENRIREFRESAPILSTVRFEIWRSHIIATVTELLPSSKAAGLQNRTINIYPSESQQATALWELRLEPDSNPTDKAGRLLQLSFRNRTIEFAIRGWLMGVNEADDERILFRIPLDAEQLLGHRVENEESGEFLPNAAETEGIVLRFSDENEDTGITWRLSIRSLDGSTLPDKWKLLEPAQARRVS